MTNKPILCLDFDGVIHAYGDGWKGIDNIYDDPVADAIRWILDALEHFEVHVFSSRSKEPTGVFAMQNWLSDWVQRELECDEAIARELAVFTVKWPTEKPPAFIGIDDRVLTFDGTWPDFETLKSFKPWNKK